MVCSLATAHDLVIVVSILILLSTFSAVLHLTFRTAAAAADCCCLSNYSVFLLATGDNPVHVTCSVYMFVKKFTVTACMLSRS